MNATRMKTKMCSFFEKTGWCKFGDRCKFAHAENELQSAPTTGPVSLEINASHSSSIDATRMKTKMCRFFEEAGWCRFGDRCMFAHAENELRSAPAKGPTSLEVDTSLSPSIDATRMKTKMCRYFEEAGCCKFDDRCTFAHDQSELKSVELEDESKYKTRICIEWETKGKCVNGDMCNYAHGSGEQKLFSSSAPAEPENPMSVRRKWVICTYFKNGHCKNGDKCTYAHGEQELFYPTAIPKRPIRRASSSDPTGSFYDHDFPSLDGFSSSVAPNPKKMKPDDDDDVVVIDDD